jgi:hypothetical protein
MFEQLLIPPLSYLLIILGSMKIFCFDCTDERAPFDMFALDELLTLLAF